VPEVPTEPPKLKQFLGNADAVIGSLPINIIQMLQNNNVVYIAFVMKSLGVYNVKEEIEKVVNQYGQDRVAVLPPSRQGEPYRLTLYQGLKAVRVLVEETPIISHE